MLKGRFERGVEEILANSDDISDRRFYFGQLDGLPEPVQRYFKYCLSYRQSYLSYVRLKHGGFFRQGEDQEWMGIRGEEYFTTQNPAFIWYGEIRPFPFIWIAARDLYVEGRSSMLVKLMSLITLADAKGEEMDQSGLVRFLSEAPWFPTVLLPGDHLGWEEVDSNSAKATIQDHGLQVSAIFHFNKKGEITHMVTEDRFRAVNDEYCRERWTTYYRRYREVDNVKIPIEGEAVWNLDTGNFSYARFILTDIEFNDPTRYRL